MDEIASHCGFTKKTQYCYFDSKDALVASIIEKELLKEKENFEKLAKEDTDILSLISKYLYKILDVKDKKDSVINIFNNSKDNRREYFFGLYEERIVNYISERIQKEIKLGTIKECNTHLTAFIIYNSYKSVIFDYDQKIDKEEVIERILGILKYGMFK